MLHPRMEGNERSEEFCAESVKNILMSSRVHAKRTFTLYILPSTRGYIFMRSSLYRLRDDTESAL